MNKPSNRHRLALAAALLIPAGLAAQAVRPSPAADPSNAAASVPAARPVSALARYRPADELRIADWKAANDTVTQIGGWRAYARETDAASVPAPAAARTPAPAASPPASGGPPAMPGHTNHGRH